MREFQDAVFGSNYDNVLKQVLKKDPEEFFEYETVGERWKAVEHAHADEKAKAAAALAISVDEEESASTMATLEIASAVVKVSELHKPVQSFALNSPEYWRALANQRVRTYVQLCQEGKTTMGVSKTINDSNMLKNVHGIEHKTAVLIVLDIDNLADHIRPDRRASVADERIAKLIHGALGGRGAPQTGPAGEVTIPLAQDILCLIDSRPNNPKPLTHPLTVVPNKIPSLKSVTLAFDDASIRARKKRVSTSGSGYSRKATMTLASKTSLFPDTIPEKQFMEPYNGYNTSDILGFVRAPSVQEVWQVSRKAPRPRHGRSAHQPSFNAWNPGTGMPTS